MTLQPLKARLFIALPIPPKYRPILNSWSEMLRKKWSFKRWLHPDDYHITLKFIGDCEFKQTLLIKERLKALAPKVSPFNLAIEGLGTFDNNVCSKILWAGVQGELHSLLQLHQQIDAAMEQTGIDTEKNAYRPHITLARNHLDGVITKEQLEMAPTIKEQMLTWQAKEIVLYQTHLGKSPAYQPLSIYPLLGS